jgi:cobalt/nickel transport system ATP-binding protein
MAASNGYTDHILSCHALHCGYPSGVTALDGVDFSLRRGEHTAIIGPNGAGKSTLLRALIGLLPFEGDIVVDGMRLDSASLHAVRSRVGLVFQNPDDQLFSPTIAEDVAFGPAAMGLPRDEVSTRTREALETVGLSAASTRNPLQLSFGERRLAAIATVLAMRPAILAMDEPSSNLDPAHRRRLIRWLQSQPDFTLLLASHDLDMVAETCPRVILLSTTVVAEGAAADILADRDLLEAHGLEIPLGMQGMRFPARND